MARHDVINKETGETKIISVLLMKSNSGTLTTPSNDWSHGCASGVEEVGSWKTKLANNHSGWKHILDKVKASPKSQAKDLY